MFVVVLLLILWPVLEIAVFLQVVQWIGVLDTLLLMLVEQKRISLDDGISRWFPQLLAADQVTVRMLVANTVSYLDYVTMEGFLTGMPG